MEEEKLFTEEEKLFDVPVYIRVSALDAQEAEDYVGEILTEWQAKNLQVKAVIQRPSHEIILVAKEVA